MQRHHLTYAIITIVLGSLAPASGCVGPRQSLDEMPRDIRWLTVALQHKGVLVRERGNAFAEVTSIDDARLVLDSKEVLDAYEFESAELARNQAFRLSGLYQRNNIFVVERLVVVRFTTHDTGLTHTLIEILGPPI